MRVPCLSCRAETGFRSVVTINRRKIANSAIEHTIHWVLILVWVLIYAKLLLVATVGACIRSCLFCMGAYYPDSTVLRGKG